MKPNRLMYIGLFALALLTGCSSAPQAAPPAGEHASHQVELPNGDLQETTASIAQLPHFLDSVDPRIKEVYRIAGDNRELLTWIPCYCGCAESAAHQNNANCFIKEVNQDGSVVWDDHGTRCGTCMDIAFESAKMKQEGKSAKEIRAFIDDKYKEGYAQPTATPMPQ